MEKKMKKIGFLKLTSLAISLFLITITLSITACESNPWEGSHEITFFATYGYYFDFKCSGADTTYDGSVSVEVDGVRVIFVEGVQDRNIRTPFLYLEKDDGTIQEGLSIILANAFDDDGKVIEDRFTGSFDIDYEQYSLERDRQYTD